MASHKISITRRHVHDGFSLIEVLIVIGLLGVIAAFTAVADLSTYRMNALRDERKTLVTALQKARSESLNNINQKAHGVAIFPSDSPGNYVVFEGNDYASADHANDQVIPSSYPLTRSLDSIEEVVFEQLSALASCDGAPCDDTKIIELEDVVRQATAEIKVNREGQIDW